MTGLVAILGSALGLFASAPVVWTWELPEECPDTTTVLADAETLLRSSTVEPPARASMRVVGRPGDYTLDLEIELGTQREQRRLQASDCALLARAGVMVVAITVDALTTARALPMTEAVDDSLPAVPPPEPSPSPRPSPNARPREPATPPTRRSSEPTPPPRPRPETPRRTALDLGAGAGLSWGLSAEGTTGFEGILGWQRNAVRLEVAGYHWLARSTSLTAGAGTRSALSGGWLRGCYVWSWTSVALPLCAGIDLAAMHGRGIGVQVDPRPVRDLWVALSAGPGLSFRPTRRAAPFAHIAPLLSVRRPAMFLQVDGQPQETFRMSTFGLRIVVGSFFRVWSRETGSGGAR